MAGKTNSLAEAFLNLVFKGVADPELASGVGSLTQFYVSLHTADPTDAGTQSSNEVTLAMYPTYARAAVERGAGFGVVSSAAGESSVHPASALTFPTTDAAGAGCTITHVGIGTAPSGSGRLLYTGTTNPTMVLPPNTPGVIPQLTPASTVREN